MVDINPKVYILFLYCGLFVILLLLFLAPSQVAIAYSNTIRKVEPSSVCMVNNAEMGKPQIPITEGDSTYYGCCRGCIGRIKNDEIDPDTGISVKYAIDPVSNRRVDKAKAVIGVTPEGKVLYFESDETFNSYNEEESD